MTDRSGQRQALIVGERADTLDPDEFADLALLADLLADPCIWAAPAPGLQDAVVDAVASAEPAEPAEQAKPAPRRRPPMAASRRWRIVLSSAAVVAVVSAIGVAVAARGGVRPDYKGELTATGLAPGAHASVDVTDNNSGFRIWIDPSGLGPLPAGEYYEAWLGNEAGTLVPIGTFSSSVDPVTLWSGVSPESFPTMTVTIEPADEDQAPSGRRVLAGEVHER